MLVKKKGDMNRLELKRRVETVEPSYVSTRYEPSSFWFIPIGIIVTVLAFTPYLIDGYFSNY